jgi:hypothetical protein
MTMSTENRVPNWKEWAMREYWESMEFARLACGVSGDQMQLDPPLSTRVNELVVIAERSIAAKTVKYHASPREWTEWAKKKEIDLPAALNKAVAKYSPLPVLDAPDAPESRTKRKASETKERDTMLRLIGGMAIAGHGVDLHRPYAAAKTIVADLEEENIKISEGTVVKYLTEAARTLELEIETEQ